jgi:thiamine-phosphate diphosphorylase
MSGSAAVFPSLHLITDDRVLSRPDFLPIALEILQSLESRVALHLRAHELPAARIFDLAATFCGHDPRPNVFINDRIDIAAAVGAAGVQLGARSLPIQQAHAILGPAAAIGYSAHSAEEAAKAEADGANFLLLGTIYRSQSHPDVTPAGPDLIAQTVRRCALPVFAIGGVTREHVPEVHAAGAHGVAVIRAIWDARDPVQAAQEFAKLLGTTENLKT